jgi:phage tail-like protein
LGVATIPADSIAWPDRDGAEIQDITIEVYNEAGELAIAYKIFRCWVSEYQALPDLDANANAVAIQHIKLQNEGWARDAEVAEPAESKPP